MEKLTTPIEGGTRIIIKDKQEELIKAELPTDVNTNSKIYWRARVQLEQLARFLKSQAPEASEELYSALVFSPTNRLYMRDFASVRTLLEELPEQASFVRFEHSGMHFTQHDGDSLKGAMTIDFTLWSRLDLWAVPKTKAAPDYLGVSAKSEWLNLIAEPLAEFISETHIADIPRQVALDSVRSALQHLSPA